FDSNEELCVGKTFQSWEHVINFMKKYTAKKDHRIRIGRVEK
ncbi:20729_t:CDS:1, partial [Gigaspora rosea]